MTNAARSPSADAFASAPLPKRFCNLDRLIHAMKARGLDGIVATAPWNVFYLTGFNGIAHKSDEPRPYAVIFARHAPEHPIMVLADYYLATFLKQPTWVEDLRPFRAVMMPLDLPAKRSDIDRFIPRNGSAPWIANARATYAFDMTSAVRGALTDLKLDNGRVGFDDMGVGFRLKVEGLEVADGYDPLMFTRAVKTPTELRLLERATALNEAAIRATMAAWDKGATWSDLNRSYARAVTELGGFVRDPGGMVWGHPRGARPLPHGHRAAYRRRRAERRLGAGGRDGRPGPSPLPGRRARAVLARGGGRDRPGWRQAAVLLGVWGAGGERY
jgi:Xaa-Pro dipeptidase